MDISSLYTYFSECGAVTTDSRNCPEGSMFIALKGESFNGNAFAAQALEKGCRYAVVDESQYAEGNPNIFVVDDCLKTLQALANRHRRCIGTRIIGITGTNGKTTTKELMAAVLQQGYRILYTQGNLNNHIGVPLTLLRLRSEHELAVIEMGANHPGEIRELAAIVEPDYGIITNVGKAHLEGFTSLEGVIRTKGELYDYLREHGKHTVFIDQDNEHLTSMSHGLKCVSYTSYEGQATSDKNLVARSSSLVPFISGRLLPCTPYLSFEWTQNGETQRVDTHLIGTYNLKNALAAIAVGRYFGITPLKVKSALENYLPQNNRSQLTETVDNHLIVDAYNANPVSMHAALENFRLMEVSPKMAILGDMKELGASSAEEHRKVAAYLEECGFDRVVLVGAAFAEATPKFEHYANAEELKKALEADKPKGHCILIKGSNSMKLAGLKEVL